MQEYITPMRSQSFLEEIRECELAIRESKSSSHIAIAYARWADTLGVQGDYVGAIDKCGEALRADPNCAAAYAAWGNVLFGQATFDGAIEKYKVAITLNPSVSWYVTNYGKAILAKGDRKAAIELFKQAIEIDRKGADALGAWAKALHEDGDIPGALDKYRQALEENPLDIWSLINWAAALHAAGDYAAAADKCQQAFDINPELSGSLRTWAAALESQGDFEGAIEKLKKNLERNPASTEARSALARSLVIWAIALSKRGDQKASIDKHNEALGIDPSCWAAVEGLGLIKLRAGEYDAAIALYKAAKELGAPPVNLICRIGDVLRLKENFEAALTQYEEALAIDPDSIIALTGLGYILGRQRRFDEAIAHLESADRKNPNDAMTMHSWADVLNRKGEFDAALAKHKEALSITNQHKEVILPQALSKEFAKANAGVQLTYSNEPVVHPSPEECIYCHEKIYDARFPLRRLEDEHIIPEGLGGVEILPRASCLKCEGITSAFEGTCLRTTYGPLRIHLKLPSKRMKDRPTTLSLSIKQYEIGKDGVDIVERRVQVPVEKHPVLTVLPSMGKPFLLGGSEDDLGWRQIGGGYAVSIDGANEKLDALKREFNCIQVIAEGRFRAGDLERMLAKIAYSYAVAQFTLSRFSPFVLDGILNGHSLMKMFVGGSSDELPANTGRHHLSYFIKQRGRQRLIVIRIGLFCDENCRKSYMVVAGRLFDTWIPQETILLPHSPQCS